MVGLALGLARMGLELGYPTPRCGVPDQRPWLLADIHYLHFAVLLSTITGAVVVGGSLMTSPSPPARLQDLTWWTLSQDPPKLSMDGTSHGPHDGECVLGVSGRGGTFSAPHSLPVAGSRAAWMLCASVSPQPYPLQSLSFCARVLLSHPGQPTAIKGRGIPNHGPQRHHRAPLLVPCLQHQCRYPDVYQYFLLCLLCLVACQPLEGEKVLGMGGGKMGIWGIVFICHIWDMGCLNPLVQ